MSIRVIEGGATGLQPYLISQCSVGLSFFVIILFHQLISPT